MATQNLSVELEARLGNWSGNLDKALSKLESFASKAEKAGQTLSLSISAPLGFLVKKMSDAFGQSDSMARGLATLEKNAGTLQARLTKLNEIAKLPGLGFDEAVAGDIRLRTVMERIYGIEGAAKMSERTMLGFGNAVALVGKGKAEFDRALYGVQQLANTKFPLGEDLNIIKDAIPQVSTLLNNAFGTDRSDELKKLGITSKQVMETILNGLEKLPRASGGWKNALENMGNSVSKSMSNVFGSIDKVLGLTGLMDRFSGIVEGIADRFTTLSPMAQKAIAVFAGLAIVIPPILAGLGLLATTILPAIAAGLGLLFSPIGLIVVAVGAAVAAIVMHWDKIKAALIESGVWEKLKTIVKSALGVIVSVFGIFANLIQGDWDSLWDHLKNGLMYAWNGMLQVVSMGLSAMNNLIARGLKGIGGDKLSKVFLDAADGVREYVESLNFKVPDVTGKVANLFEGFNFGGDREDKITGSGKGGAGTGKKGKEGNTWAERMRKDLTAVDGLVKEFEAKNPGVEVPLFLRLQKGWLQDNLKIVDKTDLPSAADIGPVQSAAQRYWQAIAKGWMTPMERAFKSLADNRDKMKAAFAGSIQASMESLSSKLAGAIPIQEIENKLAQLLAGTQNAAGKFQEMMGQLIKMSPTQQAATLKSWEDTATQVKALIESSLEGLAGSLGEVVGQIAAGGAGFSALPKMLLGVIGEVAIQFGKLAIGIGITSDAIKKSLQFLTPGVGSIVAGVALIALGTAAKIGAANIGTGAPALAEGGLAYGTTLATIGDNPRASVDPEVVAPLSKLQGMMGGGNGQKVEVTGGFRIGDLWVALKQYEAGRNDGH